MKYLQKNFVQRGRLISGGDRGWLASAWCYLQRRC